MNTQRFTLETWSPEKGWTIRLDYDTRDAVMLAYRLIGFDVARRAGDRAVRVVDAQKGPRLSLCVNWVTAL